MLDDILMLVKNLDTKGNNIKIASSNLKVLATVKSRLEKIILNPEYVDGVKKYLQSFNQIVNLQNDYFKEIEAKFNPPKLANELKKQAIQSVAKQLTETGIGANVVDKIQDILRKAITSGSGYTSLTKQLTDFLINNESGDGQLVKYTKQITTDAINQFSGQYTQLVSSDLGYEWFRYSGSNIETTRPFCLACTERKWFHISEISAILKGEFEEFKKYNGTLNKKTGLPEGMYPGTDVSNFQIYTGGYNCMHKWRPVSEDLVPSDIRNRVYASVEYKKWKGVESQQQSQSKENINKKIDEVKKPNEKIVNTVLPFTKPIINKLYQLEKEGKDQQYLKEILADSSMNNVNTGILGVGVTKVHNEHNKGKNWSNTLQMAKDINKTGYDVGFLPEHNNDSSADAITSINGKLKLVDFKHSTTTNYNTLAEDIIKGFKQAGNVVVKLENADLGVFTKAIEQVERNYGKFGNMKIINSYGKTLDLTWIRLKNKKYLKDIKGFL